MIKEKVKTMGFDRYKLVVQVCALMHPFSYSCDSVIESMHAYPTC
jgi:hypothetical protein